MIHTRAPGKLYVAGEYAIVQPERVAVIVAVNKFIHVKLTLADGEGTIRTRGGHFAPIVWRHVDGVPVFDAVREDYAANAITTIEKLRAERSFEARLYDIEISSELVEDDGRKYGLGSSAAITVAIIDAVAQLYGIELSRLDVYKLAMISVVRREPKASGGDIAAAVLRGWVLYRSPERAKIREFAERNSVTSTLQSSVWDEVCMVQLPPARADFLVGWTGTPASTEHAVSKVTSRSRTRAGVASQAVTELFKSSDAMVKSLVGHLRAGESIAHDIRQARSILNALERETGVVIETPLLKHLADCAENCGGVGKSSGAGGGDCGIAFMPEGSDHAELLSQWRSAGIEPLPLRVTPPAESFAEPHAGASATSCVKVSAKVSAENRAESSSNSYIDSHPLPRGTSPGTNETHTTKEESE